MKLFQDLSSLETFTSGFQLRIGLGFGLGLGADATARRLFNFRHLTSWVARGPAKRRWQVQRLQWKLAARICGTRKIKAGWGCLGLKIAARWDYVEKEP